MSEKKPSKVRVFMFRCRISPPEPNGMALQNTLLGVYRNANEFIVYPQSGVQDWNVVAHHELLHAQLAMGTNAGFVHQTLCHMAFHAHTPYKKTWLTAYKVAVRASRCTHESYATYCSLQESIKHLGKQRTFSQYGLPPLYQRWYRVLDDIIPQSSSSPSRILVASALARYAMDDPLDCLAVDTFPIDGPLSSWLRMLPQVDTRFSQLLALISHEQRGIIVALTEIPCPETVKLPDETWRQYYGRRRRNWHRASCAARDVLREAVGVQIPSRDLTNKSMEASCSTVLSRWREFLSKAGDHSLDEVSRNFADAPGEDPVFYSAEVRVPNMQLSGLYPIAGPEALTRGPDLIAIGETMVDCRLSPTRVLLKGQYYARYFYLKRSGSIDRVFFSITEGFPRSLWHLQDTFVVLGHPGGAIDEEIVKAVRPDIRVPILVWLSRITRESWDAVLGSADEWTYELIAWRDTPGIVAIVLVHARSNTMWAVNLIGPAAQIICEEALHRITKVTADDTSSTSRIALIASLFPFLGLLSEGAPFSVQ